MKKKLEVKKVFKKFQSTAEYAVLLGLVIAAALAMQMYVKRSLQGKIAASTDYLTQVSSDSVGGVDKLKLGKRKQYEPYYFNRMKDDQDKTSESDRTTTISANEKREITGTQTMNMTQNKTEMTHQVEDYKEKVW